MDVHMPVMDGIEASRIIRGFSGAAGRAPIVGLSASVLKEETDLCFAAGMDEFLAKPIDPAALSRVLARLGTSAATTAAATTPAPPPAAPSAPAADTLLDTTYLSALVDALGTERVAALAEALPEEIEPHERRLMTAAPGTDPTTLRPAAHALKGVAANLGLAALAGLAGTIEEAALAGDATRVAKLCLELSPCRAVSLTALRRFLTPR